MPGEAKALCAAFIWGITGVILAYLTRRIGTLSINAVRAVGASSCLSSWPSSPQVSSETCPRGKRFRWPAPAFSLSESGTASISCRCAGWAPRSPSPSLRALTRSLPSFAWLWLDETFSAGLLMGSALVVTGIVLLTSQGETPAASEVSGMAIEGRPTPPKREGWLTGLPIVLSASLFWALSTVWLRAGSGNLGPEGAAVMRVVPVSIILLIAAQASPAGLQLPRYGPFDLAGAATVGLFGLGVASLLYVSAIEEVGASRTAILTATVPLFTLPLAVIFLKERVTPRVVAGTLVCTVGIWFII